MEGWRDAVRDEDGGQRDGVRDADRGRCLDVKVGRWMEDGLDV